MPTQPYIHEDGKRVPGVTTIIGKFKDPGALMAWAWAQGRDGKDFRETASAAASAGTIAHKMVECNIKGIAFEPNGQPPEALEKAYVAFGTYLEWREQTKLEPVASEVPLVSQKHRFGGTLDAMVRINGRLSLGDVKTSSGIYQDHLYQVAAYGILWNENHPDQQIEGGYHIFRFSKEDADFHHHYFSELEDARRGFLLMRELYDLDAKLKKRT